MSVACRYVAPLAHWPCLRWGVPPRPSAAGMRVWREEAERIAAHPLFFDGQVIGCSDVLDAHHLEVHASRFSRERAARLHPSLGIGPLTAFLLVRNEWGRYLWLRRAAATVEPGMWTCGVAGYVDPAESVVACLQREAREEIGLDVSDVRPAYCAWVADGRGVVVIGHGYCAADVEIHLNAENSDCCWRSPGDPPPGEIGEDGHWLQLWSTLST